ncbi:MAG: aldehyde dehydrogenase [Balneolaceae bacterium]|nr:aldehyde dehydrogenase [Balneolaceae bacterium]
MTKYADVLEAQRQFFVAGKTKPVSFRIEQLNTLKQLLKNHDKEIMDAVYKDFKKPPFETYGTEIGLIINEINFALRNIEKWIKPKSVPTSLVNFPSKNYILTEPYGNVLIIAPWNYPVQLCLLPLVGALAAGNTAVLKPSELSEHTSAILHKLIAQYFDPSVVYTVLGGVEESSALLDLNFNYIFFTGSTRVGKIIMQTAAKKLTPVTLELGGKSPCIVEESADLEVSAKRIVWGKFVNAGQTCVAPDYLLVQESIREDFEHELRQAVEHLYGSDPSQSDDYTRIINDSHFDRLTAFLDNGRTVIGGESDSSERYIAPTVLGDVTWDHPIMQDEIFGPILPILSFNHIDEAIAQILQTTRPLALYLFTSDDDIEKKVLEQVSFGGGAINDTIAQLGNHHLSFGGVGASGFGSYHGKASFDSFSHQKSIMKKNFLVDIPLRYAPYDGKIKWLKTIFR